MSNNKSWSKINAELSWLVYPYSDVHHVRKRRSNIDKPRESLPIAKYSNGIVVLGCASPAGPTTGHLHRRFPLREDDIESTATEEELRSLDALLLKQSTRVEDGTAVSTSIGVRNANDTITIKITEDLLFTASGRIINPQSSDEPSMEENSAQNFG